MKHPSARRLRPKLKMVSASPASCSASCPVWVSVASPASRPSSRGTSRSRAKKNPQIYGGSGLALTGLILGYAGTLLVTAIAILASLMLPALAKAKGKAQSISCVNNMKQIGLGARFYANDHGDKLPPDFLSMSNELVTPKILVCNGDSTKTKAADWAQFNAAANVSYEFLLPGTKEQDVVSKTVFRCPIHGHIGLGDGSVQQVRPAARQ